MAKLLTLIAALVQITIAIDRIDLNRHLINPDNTNSLEFEVVEDAEECSVMDACKWCSFREL